MSNSSDMNNGKLRRRNLAVALALGVFVVLTFVVSIAKMGGFK